MTTTQTTAKVDVKAMLAAKQVAADKKAAKEVRVFYGDFQMFQNYLTEKGNLVRFYKGYCKSSDPEVIEYCSKLKDVTEVTDSVNAEEIEEAPDRSRRGGWQSSDEPAVITAEELLSRAVASSATVTNAAS